MEQFDPDLLEQAFEETNRQLPDAAPSEEAPDERGVYGAISDGAASIATGVAKAGFETVDFAGELFGDGPTKQEDKWQIRTAIEAEDERLTEDSTVNSLASGIGQLGAGLVGFGKIMGPIKVVRKAAKAAKEVVKASAASAVVLDPHEERFADLIEGYPALEGPVLDFMQADPGDSTAEGRLANAIESIAIDTGAGAVFMLAAKAIRSLRSGDKAAAAKVIKQLEKEQAAQAAAKGELPLAPEVDDTARLEAAASGVSQEADLARIEAATKSIAAPGSATKATTGTQATAAHKGAAEATGGAGASTQEQLTGGQAADVGVKPDEYGVRVLDISDDEISDIVLLTKEDTEEIARHGSREAAIASGWKFKQGVPLPWQKLRSSDDVQAFISRTTQILKSRFTERKGGSILTDKAVNDLVNERAEAFNEDPATIMGELVQAGEGAADMVANMEASLRIGQAMMNDATRLSKKIGGGDLTEFGGNLDLATSELKARVAAAVDVLASGQSILSNSGRALRRARGQFKITAQGVASIKDMDPNKLLRVMQLAEGDMRKIKMIADPHWVKKRMDDVTWHLTNGLLWLWPTHLVNTTTNLYMAAARPAEKLLGANIAKFGSMDPGRRAQLTKISKQARLEYVYTVTSIGDAWHNAYEAFMTGDSKLAPYNTEWFDGSTTGHGQNVVPWRKADSLAGTTENGWLAAKAKDIYKFGVGMPTRVLGTMDEFFKTARYRAVVQSRAAVEGADRGLKGPQLKAYIQQQLDKAIDPSTGRGLDPSAIREAQIATFQSELNYDSWTGALGKTMQTARRQFTPLAIVLPFVKTPVNVLRYGVKMTPGLNMLQKEFQDALLDTKNPEAQAHAIGQMTLGSLALGSAAVMVAEGRFTGGGPSDVKLKQELIATGWKPYSVVTNNEDGSKNYYQLARFDPVAMVMGMTADVIEAYQKDPEGDFMPAIGAITVALVKNMGERTFLLNLKQSFDAIADPEDNFNKWAGRIVGSALPMSSLMRGHNPDPWLREARGFVDSIVRGVPVLSEGMAKKMDVFGDPIERHVGIVDRQEQDPVEAEHNRIMIETDKGIGKPNPKFQGVDLREFKLANGQWAYERLQELSGHLPGEPSLKSMLKELIETEGYQDMGDGESSIKGTRLNALAMMTAKYRKAAQGVLKSENPELVALIGERQGRAADAIKANQAKRQEEAPGKQIMKALGQ